MPGCETVQIILGQTVEHDESVLAKIGDLGLREERIYLCSHTHRVIRTTHWRSMYKQRSSITSNIDYLSQ